MSSPSAIRDIDLVDNTRDGINALNQWVRVLRHIGTCPNQIEPETVLVLAEALCCTVDALSTTLQPITSGKPVYVGL